MVPDYALVHEQEQNYIRGGLGMEGEGSGERGGGKWGKGDGKWGLGTPLSTPSA